MSETTKHLTEREQAKILFCKNEIKMLSKMIRRTMARRAKLRDEVRKLSINKR